MKLTSAQVERTLTQFRGEAIPDDHPVIPQLNDLFGEHYGSSSTATGSTSWSRLGNETILQLVGRWRGRPM
jgi:hypothetical protein